LLRSHFLKCLPLLFVAAFNSRRLIFNVRPQNVVFDGSILIFVFLIVRVHSEDVKQWFGVQLVVQPELVRDDVTFLHKVQLRDDGRMLLETSLTNHKNSFDEVLDTCVDGPIIQNGAQSLKYRVAALRRHLQKSRAAFTDECNCQFYTVISRLFEQKGQELQCKQLMRDLLIDQVGDESSHGHTHGLVITFVRAPELHDHALQQKLSNFGQLRIHDSHKSSINVRELH
jgi:hypothetical protein